MTTQSKRTQQLIDGLHDWNGKPVQQIEFSMEIGNQTDDKENRKLFRVYVTKPKMNDLNRRTVKRARVQVETPSPEELGLGERPPIGSIRGDGSDEDKAWKEYNKSELIIQKMFLLEAIMKLSASGDFTDRMNLDWDEKALKFNKKAFCSCGCSPGWETDAIPAWMTFRVIVREWK